VVIDGALLTPPLASGCLAGITRELVLEWCDAREADLPLDALRRAEEAFLTSSTRDVQPIRQVVWANGDTDAPEVKELAVGPVSEQARTTFAERAASTPDP
jgi:branched-chain amino acid aminotransferase